MPNDYSIAVLLPTRGRTNSFTDSVTSIVGRANDSGSLIIKFGFDQDDQVGLDHFENVIRPFLDDHDVDYEAMCFESMGYEGLNRYYNTLAETVSADWFFIWNDDATMETVGWDDVVRSHNGEFKILKVHTHNEHPYSIFPIVPRVWVDTLGCLSRHQMIDAEISQNAYMLDIIEIVDIDVIHEQSELTGKQDSTSQRKNRFEGNVNDPKDFHFRNTVLQRIEDCHKLSAYMQNIGLDTTYFKNICNNQQDPWQKLKANDINHMMFQFQQTL
jgi:hypothetical protein